MQQANTSRRGVQMRDNLVFYVNGKRHQIGGEQAFMPLSTYLRREQGATGTKVVCEEGDCGACTVLLGRVDASGEMRYSPVNACIQFLYQLDCSHVVTIEGLKSGGELNAVQKAMVECHGTQCGYCTPGFVVAMCSMFDAKPSVCEQDIRDCLTGNLCRCTGYEPIIKAGLAVDPSAAIKLHKLYPSADMSMEFAVLSKETIVVSSQEHKLCVPATVKDAVEFKAAHEKTIVVAGGTDVCVFWNKRGIEPKHLLSMANVPGLSSIIQENGTIVVGAKAKLSQLEEFTAKSVPQLNNLLWLFGSPQIRNAGTLAGNIANGSPIGDSLPFLFVVDAEVEVHGINGSRRININRFYTGYKQMDLKPDEIITRIHIPIPASTDKLRLYKVSRRKHLDICTFSAAVRIQLDGSTVKAASIAYGGVAATVVRLAKTEDFLTGKTVSLELFEQAGKVAAQEIAPISDVRGSRDFRIALAENTMPKFYFEEMESEVTACQP